MKVIKKDIKLILDILQAVIVAAAIATLISAYVISILSVSSSSMAPTLYSGDKVICLKSAGYETGDVIAFYYNNRLLIRRVIAKEGQWVDIKEDGCVYVDDIKLEEPYITKNSLGRCDIDCPYQVPSGRVFVMGDNRGATIDSRNSEMGCIETEQIVGRIVIRFWPLGEFGIIK